MPMTFAHFENEPREPEPALRYGEECIQIRLEDFVIATERGKTYRASFIPMDQKTIDAVMKEHGMIAVILATDSPLQLSWG